MDADKDENLNGMDLSFEENVEAVGSGVDDSQIEDNCGNITGLLASSHPNRDSKQTMDAHDVKADTKVEKRVMNILKKAVRDQRRSKVHYLARRTKNVNWVKVADELQKKAVMLVATTSTGGVASARNVLAHEFEEDGESHGCINYINDDGDDDTDGNSVGGGDDGGVDDDDDVNNEHMNDDVPNYDDSSNSDHVSNTLNNEKSASHVQKI